MYCDWLDVVTCLIHIWHDRYWTVHITWLYHMILESYVIIIVYLYSVYYTILNNLTTLLLYGILSLHMHVHLSSFYTLIGSFLTPLDLHIQVYGYFIYWLGIWTGSPILWGIPSSLRSIIDSWYLIVLSFILDNFYWFSIAWTPYLFYLICS